jgi:hypothetical protein
MRLAIFQIVMLMTVVSWAGGEVPWPVESQQSIAIRELSGVWTSQHLEDPQRMYYFSLERGGVSESCPFILRVFEVNTQSGDLMTIGGGVFCSAFIKDIKIVMYDSYGTARNYLEIVGLEKPQQSNFMGVQLLGITLSTYAEKPEIIAQDSFHMMDY